MLSRRSLFHLTGCATAAWTGAALRLPASAGGPSSKTITYYDRGNTISIDALADHEAREWGAWATVTDDYLATLPPRVRIGMLSTMLNNDWEYHQSLNAWCYPGVRSSAISKTTLP